MKIAISANSNRSDAALESRFEKAPYFFVINLIEGQLCKTIDNLNANSLDDTGILTAQMLINKGINAVITGNCHSNVLNIFNLAGITVYQFEIQSISQLIESLKNSKKKLFKKKYK
jgi:predicted Fe-Mo cluster-binding NifX family protein